MGLYGHRFKPGYQFDGSACGNEVVLVEWEANLDRVLACNQDLGAGHDGHERREFDDRAHGVSAGLRKNFGVAGRPGGSYARVHARKVVWGWFCTLSLRWKVGERQS
jgi:hypothetical protein